MQSYFNACLNEFNFGYVLMRRNISPSSCSLFVLNRFVNRVRRNSSVDLSNSPNETF